MSTWQTSFISTNGIRVHYARTGGDRPPVVLVHGFSDDGLCWTPVASALESQYDVVMLDARGHGRSDAPAQGYDPVTMAADLAGAITGLGLRSPIILGHSMGARTAMVLACLFPALPRAIALEDPPAWWAAGDGRRDHQAWVERSRAWIARVQRQSREAIIAAQHADAPLWSEAELGPWADAKMRFNPIYFEHASLPVLDGHDLLTRLACPVLLITGDPALGAIVTDQQAAALQALVPQVRRAHIPAASHNVRRDQFELYLKAISPQLAEWSEKQ